MKIEELAGRCLGGQDNTLSIERPVNPDVPNEILYQGRFSVGFLPNEFRNMEFTCFSVNGDKHDLRADVVVYVD